MLQQKKHHQLKEAWTPSSLVALESLKKEWLELEECEY